MLVSGLGYSGLQDFQGLEQYECSGLLLVSNVFFLYFEFSGLVLRFGLRVFRVSGFRSTRTLGISARFGLRVFRASEFRAIRMLGIALGSSLGFSGVIAIRMLDCWILSGILSGTTWLPGDNLYGFGRVWVLLFDTCHSGSIMILEGSCGVPF